MLSEDGVLSSDYWFDRPDAGDAIERRFAAGEIERSQADALRDFVREGTLTFTLGLPEALFIALDSDLERVWREQPAHIAYADDGLLTRFSGQDAGRRRPGCRLADLHAFSEAARALYLDASVHAWIELLLGEPAIALQSRFYEWGGEQAPRRDATGVRMEPAGRLLTAWIACEDIAPESGPLAYVPGSHRLPSIRFDGERAAQPFTARRGEVLIRHPLLLHGGSAPADPARTCKSFVVRFAPRAHTTSTASTYLDPFVPSVVASAPTPRVYATDRLLGTLGPQGFDSPLHARSLAEPAELHRTVAHLLALLAERDATLAKRGGRRH